MDIMLKSALKKPCIDHSCNGRRVTFCETVEIYSTEILSAPLIDSSTKDLEFSLEDLADEWDPFASKCLILSWQDNGDDMDGFESRQPEKSEDFQVHKVVYDPADLKEADSSGDHEETASGNEQESDSQPFIVHQVERSEHDEDADETSSDSDTAEKLNDDTPSPVKDSTDINENVCELSVKNIEQHNKLLETEILACTEESTEPVVGCEDVAATVKEVGLSPPLRELGIDKLISQSADKWLLNLDISPLSSIQETDSESNLSSEDTMIMMTSEECEQNERRIKESFQKFELIKKQKYKEFNCGDGLSEIKCNNDTLKFIGPHAVNQLDGHSEQWELDMGDLAEIIDSPEILTDLVESDRHTKPAERTELVCNDFSKELSQVDGENKCTVSHSRRDSTISLDTSLSDVEIPRDVREWKIEIGKPVPDSYTDFVCNSQIDSSCAVPITDPESMQYNARRCKSMPEDDENKPDELELFVNQCTERVERIRKRYSLNEETVWSPRRGIRPRFGSTAEIVQQMQDGQQPVYANNHYSWPNYMSLGHENASFNMSFCSSSLPTDLYNFPPDILCNAMPQRPYIPSETDISVSKNICNEIKPPNPPPPPNIPTPFLFTFQERGVPEGASPPKLSSESLYESDTQSDSIVYYSMKV